MICEISGSRRRIVVGVLWLLSAGGAGGKAVGQIPQESKPAPQAASQAASTPWAALFGDAGEGGGGLPSSRDTCFNSFDTSKSLVSVDGLHEWFDIIAGHPQGIFETKTRLGKCAAIEGIVRLKAPWTADSVLRLALEDFNRLQIHFFNGNAGSTLIYHEDDQFRWAGYATTRKPRAVTPSEWILSATDAGRNRRTSPKNHEHYELRYRPGEIVLSRGDVILMRLPFAGPPEDVFFQGKATFHGIAIARTRDDLPTEPAAEKASGISPAKLSWRKSPDAAGKQKTRRWIATPLPRDSLAEVRLAVSGVAPGAGIYLGNGKDGPRYVLRYVRDRRSRQMCVIVRGDDDVDESDFRGLTESPLPAVPARHWIKLVRGAGQIRWWTSSDGIRWVEPGDPIRDLPADLTHVGMHFAAREGAKITLDEISVQEFSHLSSLAAARWRALARENAAAPSIGAWIADATESTPAGTDTDEWRRACALKTLAAGCPRALGNELVMLLVNDEKTRALPLGQQLRVLDEASRLIEVWDDNATLQRLCRRYHEADLAASRDESPPDVRPAFSTIRHALMTTPIATRQQVEVVSAASLRTELIRLVYSERWTMLGALARELRFFQFHQKSPLLDWAESLAMGQRTAVASPTAGLGPIEKQKEEWRDLLIEELNKDVYNLLAQWRVELAAHGREDAGRQQVARLIAAIDHPRQAGVAPHWTDPRLLVALPTAVQSVVAGDPALRRILATEFREVAELRVRQAIREGDFDSLELAAHQFAGSPASAQAYRWLGDTALSAGLFQLAQAHYERAEAAIPPEQRPNFAARRRMAEALGPNRAAPVLPPSNPGTHVELGTVVLSADAFEKLVKEQSERSAKSRGQRTIDVGTVSEVAVPPPAAYQVHRRAALDGPVGNDPNREFVRDINGQKIDWVDRQLAVTVDANLMVVSNRFQVAAYDLQSKQRTWQSSPPAGQIQFAQESTFTVCRPLVRGDRVFARLFYNPGATLGCLDRNNGQWVWTTTPSAHEELVSDPFWMGHELACFKLIRTEQLESVLRIQCFDAMTGYAGQSHEVLKMRDWWRRRRYCAITSTPDGVLVALGGIVALVDANFHVRWIRRQIVVPADEDPGWIHQYFQPPLLVDKNVVLWQPGVRTIDCVNRDTGALAWSRPAIAMQRIVGFVRPWLVCQDDLGFVAIHCENGSEGWRVGLEGIMTGVTCGPDGNLLVAQRIPADASNSRFQPRLLWIDASAGRVRAWTPLGDLTEADPRLGPFLIDQDRIWSFYGRGPAEATREVIELTPNGKAEPSFPIDPPETWLAHIDPQLCAAAGRVIPQWKLIHAEAGDRSGLLAEVHGERDALGLRFRGTGAIALARDVTIPARSKPRLRMRFGNETGHVWKLEVRFRGSPVWTQEIRAESHPQPWKDIDVDLSALAGEQGWLSIRAWLPQGGEAPSYWKTLEIVF